MNGQFLAFSALALMWLATHAPARADEAKSTETNAAKEKPVAKHPELLTSSESLKTFTLFDDLQIEPVLAEPVVRQPLFINWDDRGRMWVVQYIQYPYPAGLKMVSRDEFWRAVYDKIPEPPPHREPGLDVISIHEDTDGDGTYDLHKNFLAGLNIVTACERGRGGVWVLNPPYLLFYPDRDNDDVPDGDPEVHLTGFGMQDTHSVVNSLRWGPDGWLYAAQGSTVSGNVSRPGHEKHARYSMGQLIWRYHPETKRYEVFAEGGGNAFGVEFDDKGRAYSGHNGGNTRGFHYVQGGYYRKGFGKHGPLSNPYTFGYFEAMTHHNVPRFTHNFVIYGGGTLPEKYNGQLLGIEPLQGRVVMADMQPEGSSFKTTDVGFPLKTTDKRFRPVEIKVGPDGAVYVADMHEIQISHREHFKGNVEKETGRIYRLTSKEASPQPAPNLAAMSTAELVSVLGHPNRWIRQTALRLFGDRKDVTIIKTLKNHVDEHEGQLALECLWALNLSGGLDDAFAEKLLADADPHVRLWTVRLMCDRESVSERFSERLAGLAAGEQQLYVRSQLASSARRLPAGQALPIVKNLLAHHEDVEDIHVPLLLWWALESKVADESDAVVAFFKDPKIWDLPMVRTHISERLMRRYAQAGTRNDLVTAAKLFRLAPGQEHADRSMKGFEAAFKGRSLSGLPQELVEALSEAGGGSVSLAVRQGKPEAVDKALELTADKNAEPATRLEYVQLFGEVNVPRSVPILLELFRTETDSELRMATLNALLRYRSADIAQTVVSAYASLSNDVRDVAQTLLVSRADWCRQLLEAIEAGNIDPATFSLDVVRKMTVHGNERVQSLVAKHWKDVQGASTAQMQAEIARCTTALSNTEADPYRGHELYKKTCAKCHLLFGAGGRIGPDLTTYKRDDSLRILINVVNPSAEIREGFETFLVLTEDGRAVTGFKFDEDNQVIVIRGLDGRNITVPRDEIDEIIPQRKSLMPEGLLKQMSEQDVRDLFAYLRSSQPLNR